MPKILTVTPNEGEDPQAFSKRVADEVQSFFSENSSEPSDPSEPTDVSAETEEPAPSA